MTGKMNSKPRFVRCPRCLNVLLEPADVLVYTCGGCGATLQVKKRNKSTVDTTSHRLDNDSSGKQKVDQVFSDQIQEAGSSSSTQQLQLNSNYESEKNSDHDSAKTAENGSTDSLSHGVEEYASGKHKQKQLSHDHEASTSSLNQQDEPHQNIHNDPRSSTELSGHEDPESSPEPIAHNRIDQQQDQNQNQNLDHSSSKQKTEQLSDDNVTSSRSNKKLIAKSINDLHQNNDHQDPDSSPEMTVHNRIEDDYNDDLDLEFLSCRHEAEFEESSSEYEETVAKKLIDTRQKKPMLLEEDDVVSEASADLNQRRRLDRISTNYYGYEGSESSYDGNNIQNPRKHRIGLIENEHVDRFNRSNQIHPLINRSTEIHRNPRHRTYMNSNPKLERIELLKKVRELTDQLERTNVNNPVSYGRRMAFSGETTAVNRRLDGATCHRCCAPQDRAFSAQLTRQAQHVCCNGPYYEPNTYYSPRVSGLSTPVHSHPESGFSTPDGGYGYEYGYGYKGRNGSEATKPYRSPMKKRYVRPIANGAPWITCYRCYTLLELPQSFLVLKKRYHSLKCGACMKVLNFTLSDGMHVSRYYPEETIVAPPSSEVDAYSELNRSRAGPVSCSDRSFQKSYSTETDRNGFWESGEEGRKVTMSRDPSGSSRPSSSKVSGRRKMASEREVERRPNGSPLHRLMGYTTPSKVIRG